MAKLRTRQSGKKGSAQSFLFVSAWKSPRVRCICYKASLNTSEGGKKYVPAMSDLQWFRSRCKDARTNGSNPGGHSAGAMDSAVSCPEMHRIGSVSEHRIDASVELVCTLAHRSGAHDCIHPCVQRRLRASQAEDQAMTSAIGAQLEACDVAMNEVMFSHNASVQASTGLKPHLVLFSLEVIIPIPTQEETPSLYSFRR